MIRIDGGGSRGWYIYDDKGFPSQYIGEYLHSDLVWRRNLTPVNGSYGWFSTRAETEKLLLKWNSLKGKKEEEKMFTALIVRRGEEGKLVEKSTNGPWSAYMGKSKDEVVEKAVRHMETSNGRTGKFKGDYTVVVGEITHEVQTPVKWELVEIGQ